MMISKYENLAKHLAGRHEDMLRMTFGEIEELIDGPLPKAAYEHRAWWANSESNNHALNGWMQAGWETSQVDMEGRELMFVRRRPRREIQFALPFSERSLRQADDYQGDGSVGTELNAILNRTGGVVNLSRIIQAVEDYIHGDLDEIELGRLLRKHWPRPRR
jgi:hypothetical protein